MNIYLSSVNQKRLFARLLLDQAAAADQRHLRQALVQGAVDQLWQATRFYLGEVAATYQYPDPERADSPQALVDRLAEMNKTPAEASEILTLSGDSHSWLNRLEACYRGQRKVVTDAPRSGDGENLVSVVAMTDDREWSLAGVEEVSAWLEAFSEMVERHRDSMVEW